MKTRLGGGLKITIRHYTTNPSFLLSYALEFAEDIRLCKFCEVHLLLDKTV